MLILRIICILGFGFCGVLLNFTRTLLIRYYQHPNSNLKAF